MWTANWITVRINSPCERAGAYLSNDLIFRMERENAAIGWGSSTPRTFRLGSSSIHLRCFLRGKSVYPGDEEEMCKGIRLVLGDIMLALFPWRLSGYAYFFESHLYFVIEHSEHWWFDLDGHVDQSFGKNEANMVLRLQAGGTKKVLESSVDVGIWCRFCKNIFDQGLHERPVLKVHLVFERGVKNRQQLPDGRAC